MEDGDILSQTSIETYITTGLECSFEEVYTQKAEEFDLQRLNILSWNCVPPLYSPVRPWLIAQAITDINPLCPLSENIIAFFRILVGSNVIRR